MLEACYRAVSSRDDRFDGVFFTGSASTGRKIASAVAARLIRLQLELGGKDPAYVSDDADVAAAAAGVADGAFYNTGQSCCAVERIYVHGAIWDAFVERFGAEVRGCARRSRDGTLIGRSLGVGAARASRRTEARRGQQGRAVLLVEKARIAPGTSSNPRC